MAATAAAAVAGGRRQIAHTKEMSLKHMETNIDLASRCIQTGNIANPKVYSSTCMKLGSSVDSAIAIKAFPSSLQLSRLVSVVKEVYSRNTESLQPFFMLLMLSIKTACKIGWFPDEDKDGLLMIAKEVSYGFSNTDKMSIEPSNAHSSVSNIVSRFYPTMEVEHILTSFDVKAGFGTFIADFYISPGTTPRDCRNLWLLVAKLDNMDTADCITGPLNVDFLINGSGVPNMTRNDMEKGPTGPQLPTNITKMIKYGTNLIQVFGEFDGQYIIALAFMNSISSPDPSQLQDYLHPMFSGVDSDCDVIEMDVTEMSSQISLYCPVSKFRIKTPAKGHLCKHPQCFDYNYYIEVNSTEPTWKCPLCNNPVCYKDIRIDQDFLKILNEVAKDVEDVIISVDGSWMASETSWDTMSYTDVTTPEVFLGQTQVNERTTLFATETKPEVSPGQTHVNVCTTKEAQSTTVSIPSAGSPGHVQVNDRRTNQGQSTIVFATETKPAVSPGQTQVNISVPKQAQSTTLFTPPAGSPGQGQVNIHTTNQAQTTPMFTPPTTKTEPAVSPGESQPTPKRSRVSPTQPPEASVDAMATGRMRGSLRGEQLEAARLRYLAPPKQPAGANEPWSRPPIPSLPSAFLMPPTTTSSDQSK